MALIRNKDASSHTRSAVVLNLADIAGQAETIRAAAKQDAEQILTDARLEAQRISAHADEQGYQAGHERGLKEGLEAGTKQGREQGFSEASDALRAALNAWETAVKELNAKRDALMLEARRDLIGLSLEIARLVILQTIETDARVIEDQLAETIRLVADRTTLHVRVNPDDAETAKRVLPNLLTHTDGESGACVEVDPAVTRGGCIVRAGGGQIDSRIETQIARIVETLLPAAGTRATPQSSSSLTADSAPPAHHEDDADTTPTSSAEAPADPGMPPSSSADPSRSEVPQRPNPDDAAP